jgi:hypothetical protein
MGSVTPGSRESYGNKRTCKRICLPAHAIATPYSAVARDRQDPDDRQVAIGVAGSDAPRQPNAIVQEGAARSSHAADEIAQADRELPDICRYCAPDPRVWAPAVRMVWQPRQVPSFDLTFRATSAFCLPPNEMLRLQPGPESVVEADFIDYVTDYEEYDQLRSYVIPGARRRI